MVRFREQLAVGVDIKMMLLKVNPILIRVTPFEAAIQTRMRIALLFVMSRKSLRL